MSASKHKSLLSLRILVPTLLLPLTLAFTMSAMAQEETDKTETRSASGIAVVRLPGAQTEETEAAEKAAAAKAKAEKAAAAKAKAAKNAKAAKAQETKATKKRAGYDFTLEHSIDSTQVKSQDATGTCWSFATASFIESELLRRGKGSLDLSEMFIVRNIYRDKARNFVLRKGKANFSQGALAHDFIGAASRHGLMPESVFNGMDEDQSTHDHGEMETVLLGFLEGVVKRSKLNGKWPTAFDSILDVYMGDAPESFQHEGQTYTAKEFAKKLEFRADDYTNITSFTHHPFYKNFVLEIPDNFSNGSFYNLPMDNVVEIIDNAIENGYSVAWDGDVSERGFSANDGIAILPTNPNRRDMFRKPGDEFQVTQEMRQEAFESYSTTDDHLMHLTGIATDQNGTKYYIVKNSWGERGQFKGFIHLSESYVRMKTISILVHKDAVPDRLSRD